MNSIVDSSSKSYDVYLGFWINWSSGRIRGATLTTTRESGGLLIAFIALYVSTSGRSFWRLSCFVLHRLFSSDVPMDGLHHQRQVILRNANTAEQGMILLLRSLKWRRKAPRLFRRVIPILLYAIVVWVAFIVSGLFSSRITTATANEVLLTGKNCGIFYTGSETQEMTDMWLNNSELIELYLTQRTTAYVNYVSQCYTSSRTQQSEKCRPYVKSKLNYKLSVNASCPFQDEICQLESENLVIESDLLDSLNDFGINSAQSRRFGVRARSHCAPLVTKDFSEINEPNDTQYKPSVRFYYGEPIGLRDGDESFTYQMPFNTSSLRVANYSSRQTPNPDFAIGTVTDEFFAPIRQLRRDDGDVSLIFLSAAGVTFVKQTDDPWFAAHKVSEVTLYSSKDDPGTVLYERDYPVGVLGCVTQYQFCNPSLPDNAQCEPFSASKTSYWEPSEKLWPEKDDQKFVEWAKKVVYASLVIPFNMEYVTAGISALLVRENLRSGSINIQVPKNQWQLEMTHSFEVMLASLQGSFLDNPNGPVSPEFAPAFARSNDTTWQYMCKNQKILSELYYSFNVLGLSIILVIGGLFILLENTIETFTDWLDRRPARSNNIQKIYARMEWQLNTTWQLHRLAYEEAGYGTWQDCTETLPVTQPGEKLGVLDVHDSTHPKIEYPDYVLSNLIIN